MLTLLISVIFLLSLFTFLWWTEREARIHFQSPPIPQKKSYYRLLKDNTAEECFFNEWILAGKSKILKQEEPFLDSVVHIRFLGVSRGTSPRGMPLLFETVFYLGDYRLVINLADNFDSAVEAFSWAVANAENLARGEKHVLA